MFLCGRCVLRLCLTLFWGLCRGSCGGAKNHVAFFSFSFCGAELFAVSELRYCHTRRSQNHSFNLFVPLYCRDRFTGVLLTTFTCCQVYRKNSAGTVHFYEVDSARVGLCAAFSLLIRRLLRPRAGFFGKSAQGDKYNNGRAYCCRPVAQATV